MRSLSSLAVSAVLVLAAACGGGSSDDDSGASPTTTAADATGDLVAQPANYELLAGREQRVIVGLVRNGTARLVAYGTVRFSFFYLGTKEKPLTTPRPGPTATADYRLIEGESGRKGPTFVEPADARGVYGANGITFPDAGYWGVRVEGEVDGEAFRASSSFEVFAEPKVPAPGMPAPRTGGPPAGTPPEAIDSRAADGKPAPDAVLHTTSVADALAAGKPVVVVVSTPVFCVSQFCGPITDTVAEKAAAHPGVAFVHLEVWENFEQKKLTAWATEWIRPDPRRGGMEPWVFFVSRDGTVVERLDNVATAAEIDAGISRLLS